jgi:hypothetical protein
MNEILYPDDMDEDNLLYDDYEITGLSALESQDPEIEYEYWPDPTPAQRVKWQLQAWARGLRCLVDRKYRRDRNEIPF